MLCNNFIKSDCDKLRRFAITHKLLNTFAIACDKLLNIFLGDFFLNIFAMGAYFKKKINLKINFSFLDSDLTEAFNLYFIVTKLSAQYTILSLFHLIKFK